MRNRIIDKKNKFKLRVLNICLILLNCFILISCDKEDLNPNRLRLPQSFSFIKSDFVSSIESYDTLGTKINEVSLGFIKNDFLFSDGYIYPYKKIVINSDSTVLFYYTSHELTNIDTGILSFVQDTLYFYYTKRAGNQLVFKGLFKDNKLIIPAYGYKMCYTATFSSGYAGSNAFGAPNIPALMNRMNSDPYYNYNRLLIQRFELNYTDCKN